MSGEAKFSEDLQKKFNNVEVLLKGMMSDRSVPRNIKRVAQKGINILHESDESPGIIASNIMFLVDDLSLDPNCPYHTRSTIYRILSILETIKD
ncbi:MAG: hypothetical protein EU539_07140 [Promethearchaeota archaeon]|nr:MAG: hypothetical protein EU539_07140 [Candidatus Lokiarchaeota archaeon]